MPIDGYVHFEVGTGNGIRLSIDDRLVIDIWEIDVGHAEKLFKSATVYVKAGKHELKLIWLHWDSWITWNATLCFLQMGKLWFLRRSPAQSWV
jgi:hypothetical protein